VLESVKEQQEAQAILTEAAEDPNQRSEEPNVNFAQKGKPWSITHISKLFNVVILFICALRY
jgi:hypothetical protein